MTLLSYTVNYIPNQNRQRKWEKLFFGLFDNFGLTKLCYFAASECPQQLLLGGD